MSRKKGDKLESFVKELAIAAGDKQICNEHVLPITFDIDFIGMGILYRVGGHTLREEDIVLKKGKHDMIFVQCKNFDKHVPPKDIEYDIDHLFGAMHVFNCLEDRFFAVDLEGKDKKTLKRAGVKVLDSDKFYQRFKEPEFYSKPFNLGEVAITYNLSSKKEDRIHLYMGELTLVKDSAGIDKDTLVAILDKRNVQKIGAETISANIDIGKRFYDRKYVKHYLYVSEKGPRSRHLDVWVDRINGLHITKNELEYAFRAKNACSVLRPIKVVDKYFPAAAVDAGTTDLAEVLAKKGVEGGSSHYFKVVRRVTKRKNFAFERSAFSIF